MMSRGLKKKMLPMPVAKQMTTDRIPSLFHVSLLAQSSSRKICLGATRAPQGDEDGDVVARRRLQERLLSEV